MDQNKHALERLYNTKTRLQEALEKAEPGRDQVFDDQVEGLKAAFIENMEDDMNTAGSLGQLFDLSKVINQGINDGVKKDSLEKAGKVYEGLSQVLGLLHKREEGEDSLDEEILGLIKEREEARKNNDFARADELRDLLKEKGIAIKDSREGTQWKRI